MLQGNDPLAVIADEPNKPRLFGMLYVGEDGERHVNMKRGVADPLAVYVLNAATLAASGRAAGMDVSLITNKPERIERILAQHGLEGQLPLVDYAFTLDVPAGIPFRSAHYKLDVIRGFGAGEFGPLVGLIDIDAVILRPFTIDRPDLLHAYDISRQVLPVHGTACVATDLGRVRGRPLPAPKWYGGEFIVGGSSAFAELAAEIERLWPTYLASIDLGFHVGDEMVLSAALANLAEDGTQLVDGGTQGMVTRWWSVRTRSTMEPLSQGLSSAVLHLPADKTFLADTARHPFVPDQFIAQYREHARRSRRTAFVKNLLDLARLRRPQALPRIDGGAAG